MSDTPRTDAAQWDSYVDVDVSRTLERELNAAKGEIERLRAQVAEFHEMWKVNSDGFAKAEAKIERLRAAVGKALEALERNASQDMGVVQCNLLSASALRAALVATAAAEREACKDAVRFADNGTEAVELIRAREPK
jgi:hypothetical protein